jgi:hypothetical protein
MRKGKEERDRELEGMRGFMGFGRHSITHALLV